MFLLELFVPSVVQPIFVFFLISVFATWSSAHFVKLGKVFLALRHAE